MSHELQRRVAQRLKLLGPGPEAFFRDACRIAAEVTAGGWQLETASHLVGHLIRELNDSVQAVLYAQLVAPPSAVASPPALAPPTAEDGIPGDHVSPAAAAPLTALNAPFDDTAELSGLERRIDDGARIVGILRALGFANGGIEEQQWLALRKKKTALHRIAHRNGIDAPRPLAEDALPALERLSRILDVVLDRFEARYASVFSSLDELLQIEEPTKAHIQRLKQEVPNTPHTLRYFFERLAHPAWLSPLKRRFFFLTPPSTRVDASGNSISPGYWAAADYLRRMAAHRPQAVAEILDVMHETADTRVQAQLVEVMLELRPEDRRTLAHRVEGWAAKYGRAHFGDELARFALALIADGQVEQALTIASRLVRLPDDWHLVNERRAASFSADDAPPWYLREVAGPLFTALCRAEPTKTIDLLAAAVDFSVGRQSTDAHASADEPAGLADFSDLWIEDLGAVSSHDEDDLRVLLVSSLIRTLRQIASEAGPQLADSIHVLRRYGARVLRRVEIFALSEAIARAASESDDTALSLALERLTDSAILAQPGLDAEVELLLRGAFPRLQAEEQQRVLDALIAPTFAWLLGENRSTRRARWRRDRLAVIADHLPDRERGELRALTVSLGEASPLAPPRARAYSWSGYSSPLSQTQLAEMNVTEILGFIGSWRSPDRSKEENSPSTDGLAAELSTLFHNEPAPRSSWAPHFIAQDPIYVLAVLDGFRFAAREGRPFSWPEVLQLAEWTAIQPGDDSGAEADEVNDAHWRDARRAAADLVGLAVGEVRAPGTKAPFSERDRLWRIIGTLAEDDSPTPQDEAESLFHAGDPSTLAINRVRPIALNAAIRFAYWSAEQQRGVSGPVKDVMLLEPAVASLVTTHLGPERDPSLAVRATVGQWLTWLARSDAGWVRDNWELLFPSAPAHERLRIALWDAHLQWAQPHPQSFGLLREEYVAALERLAATKSEPAVRDGDLSVQARRLTEHVLTLYWWGEVSLDEPESLVGKLFSHPDVDLRSHALQFVGRSLFNSEDEIPRIILDRLQTLWEWRTQRLIRIDEESLPTRVSVLPSDEASPPNVEAVQRELRQFGLWFAASAFDDAWALARLREVLSVCGYVAFGSKVVERLMVLAPSFPAHVAGCLELVDFSVSNRWEIHDWLTHFENIVRPALNSLDPAAVERGRAAVNRAVAAGFTGYLDLLRIVDRRSDAPDSA